MASRENQDFNFYFVSCLVVPVIQHDQPFGLPFLLSRWIEVALWISIKYFLLLFD